MIILNNIDIYLYNINIYCFILNLDYRDYSHGIYYNTMSIYLPTEILFLLFFIFIRFYKSITRIVYRHCIISIHIVLIIYLMAPRGCSGDERGLIFHEYIFQKRFLTSIHSRVLTTPMT